jgi:putative DNA primase/helicase
MNAPACLQQKAFNQNTRAFMPADTAGLARELDGFLAIFYPDPYEPIHLRALGPKGTLDKTGDQIQPRFAPVKIETSREALSCDPQTMKRLQELNRTRGIYFVVNAGGDCDVNICGFNAWFAEIDHLAIPEQHALIDALPLPPSIRVETKKSVHSYWLSKTREKDVAAWRAVQRGLITRLGSDPAIKNPSRVMRLPFFDHVTYLAESDAFTFQSVKLIEADDVERRYTLQQMQQAYPTPAATPKTQHKSDASPQMPNGECDLYSWEGLHIELRRRVIQVARLNAYGNYVAKCPAHNGTSETSLFFNPTTSKVACTSANAHCSYADILRAFDLPAFPRVREVQAAANGAAAASASFQPPRPPDKPPADPTLGEPPSALDPAERQCTDMGNGYRFTDQHRGDALYCHVSGKWNFFSGQRWVSDDAGEVLKRAKQTVRSIYNEAGDTLDDGKRKALAAWAKASESDSRMRAMLHQAECELPIKLEAFDADPMLFNCANGTLDLRTGNLRPHERADMLTKITPINYDPNADCALWENFLFRIFAGNVELINFIQRAVGYSLSGDTSEQCLFLLHGSGANGKSVLVKTIAALTGEYGEQVATESLMAKKHGGVNNDIAALRGARFVSATETESGHRLAESLVKQITGGDIVKARFLFQEYFSYEPRFKVWLAANHKPDVKIGGFAMWRRIRLLPFEVTIPPDERDAHLTEKLRETLPGILAWAVRGCLEWQANGLGEPQAVRDATAAYQVEQDPLAGFLSDTCEIGKLYQVTAREIYAAYEHWCSKNGETAQPSKWLGVQLKERGFQPDRETKDGKRGRFWRGLGLIRDDYEG